MQLLNVSHVPERDVVARKLQSSSSTLLKGGKVRSSDVLLIYCNCFVLAVDSTTSHSYIGVLVCAFCFTPQKLEPRGAISANDTQRPINTHHQCLVHVSYLFDKHGAAQE